MTYILCFIGGILFYLQVCTRIDTRFENSSVGWKCICKLLIFLETAKFDNRWSTNLCSSCVGQASLQCSEQWNWQENMNSISSRWTPLIVFRDAQTVCLNLQTPFCPADFSVSYSNCYRPRDRTSARLFFSQPASVWCYRLAEEI
jgi:hypothetical protein